MRKRITRETFYTAVWSKPIVQVAEDFGVSDVMLARVCRNLDVPLPPRGYWAKRWAGQKVYQMPLPSRRPGGATGIWVYWEGSAPDERALAPVFDEPMEVVHTRADQILGITVVHRNLQSPHPLVAGLLGEDHQRRHPPFGFSRLGPCRHPLYETEGQRRKLLLVSSVLSTLENAGYHAERIRLAEEGKPRERFYVMVEASSAVLDVSVKEAQKGPASARPQPKLTVRVGHYIWENPNPTHRDTIRDIAIALVGLGEENLRASEVSRYEAMLGRLQRDVEQHSENTEGDRQQEHKQTAELEHIEAAHAVVPMTDEDRVSLLMANADALRRANDIRTYVQRVREEWAKLPPVGNMEGWAKWALAEADKLDPIVTGSFLRSVREN